MGFCQAPPAYPAYCGSSRFATRAIIATSAALNRLTDLNWDVVDGANVKGGPAWPMLLSADLPDNAGLFLRFVESGGSLERWLRLIYVLERV